MFGRVLFGVALLAVPALAAPPAAAAPEPKWEAWFDGATLRNWTPTDFETGGRVAVEPRFRDGRAAIVLEKAPTLTGINWTGAEKPPRTNYELELEAMRLEGGDFFCGLTFPVGSGVCSLIVGGWGGMVVGISSIDGNDASDNETTQGMEFADQRWYRIRVRVTAAKLEAWIDDVPKIDVALEGKRLSLRPGEIEKSLPLGVAAYQTRAAIRGLRLRRL
jgi:hypothetical protein